MAKTKKYRLTAPSIVITALIAGFLLLIANTALWMNRQVFNTENFTSTAEKALLSDSSRSTIASEIVDQALADRPVIKRVAGDTLTKVISGMLGSSQFDHIFAIVISKAQAYIIAENQQSVIIDLSGIKDPVEKLVVAIGESNGFTGEKIEQIPDQIILVDANKVPDLYGASIAILWAGPICAVIATILFAITYFQRKVRWTNILITQGVAILLTGLVALLMGPLLRPTVLAFMPDANIRTVVGNIFDAFIATFNTQSWWLIWIGLAAIMIGLVVIFWPKIYGLYRSFRAQYIEPSAKKAGKR